MARIFCNNNYFKVRLLLNKYNNFTSKSSIKTIMTTEFKSAEAVEELKNNPYYEKYSKKIAALQQTSPEEFLSRLEENSKNKTNKNEEKDFSQKLQSAKPGIKRSLSNQNIFTKPKELNDVLKIDLIKDKNKVEITEIWLEYFKHKDAIAAAVPIKTYELIISRSSLYPVFLLPLPRKQGYEFIVCQFSGSEIHFTPLIAYQTHKENAPECLTVIYYPDLKDTKDIILMKGEFDKDIVSSVEAQCLANQLQLFYGEENEKRTRMLERFTHEPNNFKHMDLVAEFECLSF